MPASRAVLSGIDYFRRIQSGEAPRAAMLELLGMRLLEVDEGRVVFGVTPTEQHYNATGIAHGGLAATLLDSALGCAINTLAPAGRVFTTLELKVNFTRPIRVESGALRCEAHVVHMGSRTATSEGRIVDARGKLYAHGTTTCIVVDT
ncbi:MAG TPA: PaaI family thioesterase [Vicinamibacterales bacterium]|nr:PaaI family thioesterase [Vicinamibacterales bacterium]